MAKRKRPLIYTCPKCGSADCKPGQFHVLCNRCDHVGKASKFRQHRHGTYRGPAKTWRLDPVTRMMGGYDDSA